MAMAVLGADGSPYITQNEATTVLTGLFTQVRDTMMAQNAETQGLIAQLRSDVQSAVTAAQAGAEGQVETLRSHTRSAVEELEKKLSASVE